MKKSLLTLLLLLALMVPWTAKAQTIETIGTGTYSTGFVFPGFNKYHYTVSLYKPDVAGFLNDDFNLSSIAYDVESSNVTIDELTIWVKDVDQTDYSNSSYIRDNTFSFYLDGATQVYATTTSFNLTTGWNTFNFTTNFSHRAGKALLVIVRGVSNNTVSSSDRPYYRYTYNSGTVWYRRRDIIESDYTILYGDNNSQFTGDLANLRLGVTYATGIPSDLTVAYPEGIDTEVTLGWTENGEATAWQICIDDDETHLIEANSNPFTLTNLTPETTYTAKVRANHGDTQSDWSLPVSFTPTFKTVLGTATGAVGFLPCAPQYEYSMTQQIYTAAELGNAADLISIDFYNDGNGEATRDLQIYMTHTDQNAFANLYYDWINVASTDLVFSGEVHFVSKGWTSIVLDTPFVYDGQHNVVITVDDNTGSTAGQSIVNFLCYSVPGAGLQSKYFNDDYNHNYDPTNNPGSSTYALNQKNHIRVMKVQPPTGLTVSNVTSQSATLGWTENGTATSWEICLNGDMNNLIEANNNPFTLTGLTPETTYTAKVRAICAEGHTSWTNEVSFTALLGIMVCYRENFDSYTNVTNNTFAASVRNLPEGWTAINTNTNATYSKLPSIICWNNLDYTHLWMSPLNSLWFYVAPEDNNDIYAIMPAMNTQGKQVMMYAGHGGNFTVGLMTDPTDANTFVACSPTYVTERNAPRQLILCTLTGQGNYIAIKYSKGASDDAGYIDNVVVYDGNPITVLNHIYEEDQTSSLPFASTVYHSYSQQIYTTDELGEAGVITSIGFLKNNIASASPEIAIFMVSTDKQDFSIPGIIPYDDDDQVFYGVVDFNRGLDWYDIPLDIPFLYDGEHNICLTVVVEGSTDELMGFDCFTTSTDQVINLGLESDINNKKNNLMFAKTQNIIICTNLSATTHYSSADLTWNGVQGAQSYTVRYMPVEEETGTPTEWQTATTTQTNLQLTGLDASTEYMAQVRSNLSDELWSHSIRFTTQGPPTKLQCLSVSTTSASLNWRDVYTPEVWQICINGDEDNLIEVTEKQHTLTNLTPMTSYTAKVRGRTGSEYSEWSNETVINTAQEPVSLPYSTDFETASDWYLINGGLTNAWAWGEAAHNGEGTHGLYISNDGGVTNAYDNASDAYVFAVKTFNFEADIYKITFDWRANGYGSSEYLRVVLVPANQNLAAESWRAYHLEIPPSSIAADGGSELNQSTEWNTLSNEVIVPSAGTYYLAFLWQNLRFESGENPPAAIDNVSIAVCECPKPVNFAANVAEGTNTAELSWTEIGEATHWQVCLDDDEDNLIDVTTEHCTLTGLAFENWHTVKVRANCGDSNSDWSNTISFEVTQKHFIGTGILGSNASSYYPFHSSYNYSLTHQIYTVDEFGDAGLITSIEFWMKADVECIRDIDIYMVHTDKEGFTDMLDWIPVTDDDRVFRGTVDFASKDWTTITLDTPFNYDGQHNVALIVDDNTGSRVELVYFLEFTILDDNIHRSIYQFNYYTNFDPKGTPQGSSGSDLIFNRSSRNQIRILKVTNHTTEIAGYGTGTGKWHLVASPLAAPIDPTDVTNMLSNEYDLYRFNQGANLQWENWKSHANNDEHYHFNLESGSGYLYANSGNVTLVFSGTPYSGNGQVTLSKTEGASLGEWNLIGNPLSTAATIGSKPFYCMNEGGTEIIADTEPTIAAMEGIFVKANEDGETVTFATGAKRGSASMAGIVANLSQDCGTVVDRVIVRFGEGETLPKLQIHDNSTKVYIPQDGKDYAIVNAQAQGELPLGFEAETNGTYTLAVNAEGIEMEYLHLIDNMTGADVDLIASPTYTFTAKTTDYASRFRLMFSPIGENADGDNGFAYYDGNAWVVGNEGRATLQVTDVLGHVLHSETIDGNATFSANGLAAGVYVMRLVNGEEVRVQKIVVK